MDFDNLDISAGLRAWVSEHPNIEADQAIEQLLIQASETWNRRLVEFENDGFLPGQRIHRSVITTLICGVFSNNEPRIVKGRTYVSPNNFSALHEMLPTHSDQNVYLDGTLDDLLFPTYIVKGDITPRMERLLTDPAKSRRIWDSVKANLSKDTEIAPLVKRWELYHTALNRPKAQKLLTDLFGAVESIAGSGVGPPNNIRILNRCGRIAIYLDTTWAIGPCPTQPGGPHLNSRRPVAHTSKSGS